jgi:hypothetical protein
MTQSRAMVFVISDKNFLYWHGNVAVLKREEQFEIQNFFLTISIVAFKWKRLDVLLILWIIHSYGSMHQAVSSI